MNLRSAVVGSLLLHGALFGAYGAWGDGGTAKAPVPATVTWEVSVQPPVEPNLPPLEASMPVETLPAPDPSEFLDPPPEAVDPRLADPAEPQGPPPGVIGISSIDGRRRGLPRTRGGGAGPRPPGAEPPPPEPPTPPEPDPVFQPPRLKVDLAPVYPQEMRRRGVEGTVRVRVEVEADGSVRATAVAVSSGSPALDAAALEAALEWLFEPATEDGLPVAAIVYRWVAFRLTDGR